MGGVLPRACFAAPGAKFRHPYRGSEVFAAKSIEKLVETGWPIGSCGGTDAPA